MGNNKADEEESMWPSSNVIGKSKPSKGNGSQSSILETVSGKRKKKKAKGNTNINESDPTASVTPVDKNSNPEPTPKDQNARILVKVINAQSTTGDTITDAKGKATYSVSSDGTIEPQIVKITISAPLYKEVETEYSLDEKVEKGMTHTVPIEFVVLEPENESSQEPTPKPQIGLPTTSATPTVEGEGEKEGNTDEIQEGGLRLREIKIDGKHRHLIPLHDGEFACKLVLNVAREYNGCKLELFVQGVNGKIPLKLKNVSDGCQKGGIDDNEIYGFNLVPGNNTIKFTPAESVKVYTLIIKAYGN